MQKLVLLMCLVATGQDGNGLQLENFWQIFFKVLLSLAVSDKTGKN